MKSTEYLVEFDNGKKEYFYCMNIKEVIVTAMYWSIECSLDSNIKVIFDEMGHKIKHIVINYEIE
jgi:hypothetical protein